MDADVNSRWGNFYRNTATTLERAYLRPRHDGAIAFQTSASTLIREALEDKREHRAVMSDLQTAYARSRLAQPKRNPRQK